MMLDIILSILQMRNFQILGLFAGAVEVYGYCLQSPVQHITHCIAPLN